MNWKNTVLQQNKWRVVVLVVCALFLQACTGSQQEETLGAKDFQSKFEEMSDQAQLLDVRTPEEFAGGHLDRALNMDIKGADFEDGLKNLHKNQPVFVYCLSGGRSAAAAEILKKQGFTQVYNLKGGIMAWKSEGLPITEATATKPDIFTKVDFDRVLQENPVVLVDFYADWCAPCKKMEPTLSKLSQQYKDKVLIYRINVEEAKALSSELKIDGIPLFHLYKNGKLTKVLTGYQEEKQLNTALSSI